MLDISTEPASLAANETLVSIMTAAGQIKFPGVQNPSSDVNTLDDYEEGTFTPNLLFGGSAVGMTYTNRLGFYTKIGNSVFFTINITLSAKGSSVGTATISGMPFTSSSVTGSGAGVYSTLVSSVAGVAALLHALIGASASNVSLFYGSATGSVNFTDANATNTSIMVFVGMYRTA